jgi:hypothetical protein
MADRMLFLGWGQVVRGREERALEVFNESMGLYGRMQQEGRIESFDVVLLDPHAGALDGYVEIHGSAAQIAAVREDEEFRRLQIDVSMIIDDLRVVEGYVNEGVAREMAMYTDALARIPQHT